MLYVAIWYVSKRPVVMMVKKELQFFLHHHNNRVKKELQFFLLPHNRVKEELQFCLHPHNNRVKEATGRIETYQTATYSVRTLLKMDYWCPKHVELLNVMNKINHQILCILFDYIYIAKWYTVHTVSNP